MKQILCALLLLAGCSRLETQTITFTTREANSIKYGALDWPEATRQFAESEGDSFVTIDKYAYLLSTGWTVREKQWQGEKLVVTLGRVK